MATTETIAVTTDFGSVANALAAAFKAFDTLETIFNSPQMVQARKNVAVQAALDKLAQDATDALKTGDMTQVQKDLSL
jgi:hypothetical protein